MPQLDMLAACPVLSTCVVLVLFKVLALLLDPKPCTLNPKENESTALSL